MQRFFAYILSQKEEKTSEKKKKKIMFSYQSLAHIPKIRQIWPKIKNCPNLHYQADNNDDQRLG